MADVGRHLPARPPDRFAKRRRWVGPLVLIVVLLLIVAVAVLAGWADWLIRHPGQAWQWVTKHLLASTAMAVIVAALGVGVAWVGPRAQQRRADAREDAKGSPHDNLDVPGSARPGECHSTWPSSQAGTPKQAQADAERARHEAREAAERQAAWEQRCRSLLIYWPLPRVTDANPYDLGVFNSRRAEDYRGGRSRPPYVPRAADAELARLLRSQQLVLVKGQSRAGKSRTAYEVAARELCDWRLMAPTDRASLTGLAELESLPGQGERMLVWLDDLDRYLAVEGTRGLNAALLGRWAASDPPVKVLATIRLEEFGRLIEAPGELGRNVRELLNRFNPGAITLRTTFDDPAEQAAIANLYPDEQVSGGLAEHLAAAQELVNRLEIRPGSPRAPASCWRRWTAAGQGWIGRSPRLI
jgi:hypothetical protein